MNDDLLNFITPKGSIQFGELPEIYPWSILRKQIKSLKGAFETGYVSDDVTEFWLDFEYREHKFSINNNLGDFWFFVENPECPDEILSEVLKNFDKIYSYPKIYLYLYDLFRKFSS